MRAAERAVLTVVSNENAQLGNDSPTHPRTLTEHLDATARACQSRLSAILVADMVNYSKHMAEDEAGTYARLASISHDVIQPIIAQEAGHTVKRTGDGLLALFVSATSAVLCALRLQGAIRAWNESRAHGSPLQFRIGINLGDVIVERHDVFGHSVNVAARLEAMAEPGGILASHAVVASVRNPEVFFEDAGELTLKNIAETVRSFRVQAKVLR